MASRVFLILLGHSAAKSKAEHSPVNPDTGRELSQAFAGRFWRPVPVPTGEPIGQLHDRWIVLGFRAP
jgi:hypothetical protein